MGSNGSQHTRFKLAWIISRPIGAYCSSFHLAAQAAASVCRQAGGVEGIVNGMDTTDWSPNVDKFLDVKYDADTVDEGKALAKETLQAELGLPVSNSTGFTLGCLQHVHL